MQENDKPVLVYSTFPTAESAEAVGGHLVDARLAACVNVIPGMTSIYHWQGERHRDSEVVMIVKTRASLAERVIRDMREPALLVLPLEGGSEDFLGWILDETANSVRR